MTEALLLPGQPPIEQRTVKIWSQIQRTNWIACLTQGYGADFFIGARSREVSGFSRDRYIITSSPNQSNGQQQSCSRLTILRLHPDQFKAIAIVTYVNFGSETLIAAQHPDLGTHFNKPSTAVAGLLEYTLFQRGREAYDIALRRVRS